MSDASSGSTSGGYPAGWYPLPDGRSERYWDGIAWTDSVRPVAAASGAVPPPPVYPTFSTTTAQTAAVPAKYHGPAIASMVLGIVSLVIPCVGIITSLIGLVLGVVSLGRVQPRGERLGRGMALAGIICSSIALALYALFILLMAVSGS